MSWTGYATTLGTTAVVIEGTQFPGWVLKNVSDETIYLGDSAVTTSTGFPVESGQIFSPSDFSHKQITGKKADKAYGIAANASKVVRVLAVSR